MKVRYSNSFGEISLGELTADEINILMVVCANVRNRCSKEMELSFSDMRKQAKLSNCDSKAKMVSKINSLNEKINRLQISNPKGDEPIFAIEVVEADSKIAFKANENYSGWFTDLTADYSEFELEDFLKLKSKYAKNLFRLLIRFDNNEKPARYLPINKIRSLLGVPESYEAKKIKSKIIKPCLEEFANLNKTAKESEHRGFDWFPNLRVETKCTATPRKPVEQFIFYWKHAKATDEVRAKINAQKQNYYKKREQLIPAYKNFKQNEYDFDEIEAKFRKN